MGFILVLLFFCFNVTRALSKDRWGIVLVPVADIRAASGALPLTNTYDPNQETQSLYGETVKIVSEEKDWLQVEAADQLEFSHHNFWQGYPGWIKKEFIKPVKKPAVYNAVVQEKTAKFYSDLKNQNRFIVLSMGTKIYALQKTRNGFMQVLAYNGKTAWMEKKSIRFLNPPLSVKAAREKIIESAHQLMGDPYFWGGRSAHTAEIKNQVTAVDCSGLVNLAYRTAGIDIPRDSYEQFLKAKKIGKSELKKGDLIFSAPKEKPDKITHVAIFINENLLIEAPKTGETVREISCEDKYGLPLEAIKENEINRDRAIYFGTYFEN